MAREKLIGYYGKFSRAALGAEVIAAATLTADAWYLTTGVDGSTALPTGATVGYIFKSDGSETLTGTDKAKPITFSESLDISGWSLEFSKSEVDVTTLDNDHNVFLAGRDDVTGSAEGIFKIGATDIDGGFINAFVDIVSQADAGGAITIDTIDDAPIIASLYKQKDISSGETEEFYFMPITVTGFSDGVKNAEAQGFTASFRLAPNDELKFQLVKLVVA